MSSIAKANWRTLTLFCVALGCIPVLKVIVILGVIFSHVNGGLYSMLNLDDSRGSHSPLSFCAFAVFLFHEYKILSLLVGSVAEFQ